MSQSKSILICQCAERGLVNVDVIATEGSNLSGLVSSNAVVPDLCKAAAEKDPLLEEDYAEIHACYPRAVRALFDFAGHPLKDECSIFNHRKDPSLCTNMSLSSDQKTPAWFPVIDYARCTSCGQCHEFCLFGVYEKTDDGRVVVIHPESCKNNCPACARICPETAIIFPKVGENPINGAVITDESIREAKVKINVDEILGDDVYTALKARKQKRRSLLNQKKVEQALEERRKCSEHKT